MARLRRESEQPRIANSESCFLGSRLFPRSQRFSESENRSRLAYSVYRQERRCEEGGWKAR